MVMINGYIYERTKTCYIDEEKQMFFFTGCTAPDSNPSVLVEFNDSAENFYVPDYNLLPNYELLTSRSTFPTDYSNRQDLSIIGTGLLKSKDRRAFVIPVPFSATSSEQKEACTKIAKPIKEASIDISFDTNRSLMEVLDRITGCTTYISGKHLSAETKQRHFPSL